MDRITLTQDTIDAIVSCKRNLLYESYDELLTSTTKEFHQGDCLIFVDFNLDMQWVQEEEVHSEVPPPNIEDLSHWECYNAYITDVCAYDSGGCDLIISNIIELYDEQA